MIIKEIFNKATAQGTSTFDIYDAQQDRRNDDFFSKIDETFSSIYERIK